MPREIKKAPAPRPVLQWKKGTVIQTYEVSDTDRVWLARSLWREGAPRTAVGHTLLQRFASLHPRYSTLTRFLRAYVQPINPQWFPTGYKHKRKVARLKKAGKHDRAADEIERARRRIGYARTPWEKIPQRYRELTDRLIAGAVPNPVPTAEHFSVSLATPGATHAQAKAEAEAYAKKRGLGPPVPVPGGFGRGQNWFFQAPHRKPPRLAFITGKPVGGLLVTRKVTPGETAATAALALALVAITKRPR